MRGKTAAAAMFLLGWGFSCSAAEVPPKPWEDPRPVGPSTLFFGEPQREEKPLAGAPDPSDKAFPWYCLEKGSEKFLAKDYEKAAVYFRAAYAVPGQTRVLSGFRLVEALENLGQAQQGLDILEEMEREDLISPHEFEQALRVRMALLDVKRKQDPPPGKKPAFTGRDWVLQLQDWRLQYVQKAMDELRRHGVPLKESTHAYVFLLDELFLADPEAAADDAMSVLASLVYERDADARIPIDRWRKDSAGTVTEEAKAFEKKTNKMTGAEWVILVHKEKLEYTAGAMRMLLDQHVPMEKGVYGYTESLDNLFTEKPELPAADSVVALASLLHANEPEARAALEALRLE